MCACARSAFHSSRAQTKVGSCIDFAIANTDACRSSGATHAAHAGTRADARACSAETSSAANTGATSYAKAAAQAAAKAPGNAAEVTANAAADAAAQAAFITALVTAFVAATLAAAATRKGIRARQDHDTRHRQGDQAESNDADTHSAPDIVFEIMTPHCFLLEIDSNSKHQQSGAALPTED
jgi:hypothetical protein